MGIFKYVDEKTGRRFSVHIDWNDYRVYGKPKHNITSLTFSFP